MNSSYPENPIAAAMHPNPYPYYADLTANRPLYRDEKLGAWVASSAQTVTAVLTSAVCRVRPRAEPVPKPLLGSKAGEIFGSLIRMNDGAGHCPFARAVSVALASVTSEIEASSARIASELSRAVDPNDLSTVSRFAFELSSHVLGESLGISKSDLGQVSSEVSHLVRCIFGATRQEEIERGTSAANRLWERFEQLLNRDSSRASLLTKLARAAISIGCEDRKVIVANSIGFLTQAHEATAGLISNSLLALNGYDVAELSANPSLLRELILEVLRFDPPNHNTRRFVHADGVVGERNMKADDMILVLLAAANRDPAANEEPHRFDPSRKTRTLFTFGRGMHACPGDQIALHIVTAGVKALLDSKVPFDRLPLNLAYRVSPNTHIPLFA